MKNVPQRNPNTSVDGLPPAILGKITSLIDASFEYAFIGAKDPQDYESIEREFDWSRYQLERTIKNHLDRSTPDILPIWMALMTAHILIDDLIAVERAGVKATGFKKGVPERMRAENQKAFKILAKINPGFKIPD